MAVSISLHAALALDDHEAQVGRLELAGSFFASRAWKSLRKRRKLFGGRPIFWSFLFCLESEVGVVSESSKSTKVKYWSAWRGGGDDEKADVWVFREVRDGLFGRRESYLPGTSMEARRPPHGPSRTDG